MFTYEDMKKAAAKGVSFEEFFETSGLPELRFIKRGKQVWRASARRELKPVYEELLKKLRQ